MPLWISALCGGIIGLILSMAGTRIWFLVLFSIVVGIVFVVLSYSWSDNQNSGTNKIYGYRYKNLIFSKRFYKPKRPQRPGAPYGSRSYFKHVLSVLTDKVHGPTRRRSRYSNGKYIKLNHNKRKTR